MKPQAIQFEQQMPALGAHLVTPRRGFTHHGIYVGKGHVIHYGGISTDFQIRPVEEITLAEFAGEYGWFVKYQPALFSGAEIAKRARSRVGEDSYQLVKNNCEHFCQWCRVGRAYSDQVASWLSPKSILRNVKALGRLGGNQAVESYPALSSRSE